MDDRDGRRPEPGQVQLREAAAADLEGIEAVCDRAGRTRWTAPMIAPSASRTVLVAVLGSDVVGVAKTHHHPEPDGPAPAGHYLGGVVVAPGARRRGVGSALTRARLAWIWSRSPDAWYFTNEHNAASVSMHDALGFLAVARCREIHGVTADDGRSELVLFVAGRPPVRPL